MDQTNSEAQKAPGPDGNQENRVRRSSIELKRVDATEDQKSSPANPTQDGPKYARPEIIFKGEREPGTWMFCLKCSLIVLNTCIWVLGAAITGISIWMLVDSAFWDIQLNLEVKTFSTGIYIGIAIGVFILLVGLFGCIGAWKENMCLLLSFAIIIVVLVLLEATAMGLVWAATNNSELQENLKGYIRQGINRRYETDSVRYFVDLLQAKLECCGVDDEEEFGEDHPFPDSCKDPNTGFPYERGCLEAAIKYLKSKAGILGGTSAAIFALQVAALTLTVCLFCGLRQAKQNIF